MSNNARIYKNTAFLYIRMFVMMIISLFSSRIVLQALGKSDYGLYSVVGGFIAFFFFFSNSLSVAVERFMAFAIGSKDDELRKKVFSLSVALFSIITLVLFIVGIAIGIPFVKYQLNIPPGREEAALTVFILSLLTTIIYFFRIPYDAAIIANERMKFYSWMSIVEAVLKLLLVYLLLIVAYDKLISYSIFILFATFVTTLVYVLYCGYHFKDYTRKHIFDKNLIRQLGSFAGWNFYGGLADMVIVQGLSVVFNLIFGTIINAAQALANQIKTQIASFVNNINIASGPAFTKYYAEGNFCAVRNLLFTISKMNYYILLLISLPVIFILPTILDIWLGIGTYPEITIIFTRLILINTLIDTIPGAAQSVVHSSGKIRRYEFFVAGLKIFSFLVIYVILKLGFSPEYAYYILILCAIPRVLYQIYYCSQLITIRMIDFIRAVVFKEILVSLVVICLSQFIYKCFLEILGMSFVHSVMLGIIIVIGTLLSIYMLGLETVERTKVRKVIWKYVSRS